MRLAARMFGKAAFPGASTVHAAAPPIADVRHSGRIAATVNEKADANSHEPFGEHFDEQAERPYLLMKRSTRQRGIRQKRNAGFRAFFSLEAVKDLLSSRVQLRVARST